MHVLSRHVQGLTPDMFAGHVAARDGRDAKGLHVGSWVVLSSHVRGLTPDASAWDDR